MSKSTPWYNNKYIIIINLQYIVAEQIKHIKNNKTIIFNPITINYNNIK